MARAHDFGLATAIAAEAIGEPGQRTFRLLIRNGDQLAVLWLEKEQLQALALAAEELLAQIPGPGKARGERQVLEADPASDFRGPVSIEFKIGQLGIGYDEEGSFFVLLAHDQETEADAPANFRCMMQRAQLAGLGQQAAGAVAAGRPRCILCGSPLEPSPHFCPPSNGHGTRAELGEGG